MLTQLTNWFSPPHFADKEKTRIARFLHVILLAAVPLVFLLVILSGIRENRLFSVSNLVLIIVSGLCLAGLIPLRRGYVQPVGWTLIIIAWVGMTFLSFVYFGIRDTAFLAHVIIILAAGLLLGWRASILMTALTLVAGGALGYAEYQGWLVYEAPDIQAVIDDYIIVFMLIGLLTYMLIRSLSIAVEQAQASNAQLRELSRNLEEQVIVRTESAEQARQEAEEARLAAEAAQLAMSDQVWLSAGQAVLNDQMRGEQNVQTLAQNVIGQICRYVQAPVGSLFMQRGETFHLAGGYAYAPADPPIFKLGEGLIGQAAKSQQVLHLQELDDWNVTIISGLGIKEPTDVYAFPLLFEGEAIGVIELYLWRPLTELQETFVNSILENIAVAFHTAQARMRINELLQVTQQQTEELQAQEEELRASNEALEAQAAAWRHKHYSGAERNES